MLLVLAQGPVFPINHAAACSQTGANIIVFIDRPMAYLIGHSVPMTTSDQRNNFIPGVREGSLCFDSRVDESSSQDFFIKSELLIG